MSEEVEKSAEKFIAAQSALPQRGFVYRKLIQCYKAGWEECLDQMKADESEDITRDGLKALGFTTWQGWMIKDAWPPGHPSQRFDLYWSESDGFMTKSRYQEDQPHFYMRHIKTIADVKMLYLALTGEQLFK
jgi:hypothetical protein